MNITAMVFLQLLLIVLALLLAVPVLKKAKRAKQTQDRLIEALPGEAAGNWYRINITRPAQFARKFKLLWFEARGLLINTPGLIRIVAELPDGQRIDRAIPKDQLRMQWLGNSSLSSSNLHWLSVGAGDQALIISADTGFNAIQSREATADLWRKIAPQLPLPPTAATDFALEKNPASLAAVVGFFALLLLAVIDGVVLNQNELINWGRHFYGAPLVPLCAIPCYWLLSRRQVPSREALVLTMLLGLALSATYIPALKRLDQLLASEGAKPIAYRLGANASFESVDPGGPKLNFSHRKEYWAQFPEGSTHYFALTHGPLGLWQLDHSRLDREMDQYYEKHPEIKRGSG